MRDYIIGGTFIVAAFATFAATGFVAPAPKVKMDRVQFGTLAPQHVIDWRFPEASPDWR